MHGGRERASERRASRPKGLIVPPRRAVANAASVSPLIASYTLSRDSMSSSSSGLVGGRSVPRSSASPRRSVSIILERLSVGRGSDSGSSGASAAAPGLAGGRTDGALDERCSSSGDSLSRDLERRRRPCCAASSSSAHLSGSPRPVLRRRRGCSASSSSAAAHSWERRRGRRCWLGPASELLRCGLGSKPRRRCLPGLGSRPASIHTYA